MLKVAEGESLVTLPDGTELKLRIDHEAIILAEDVADAKLQVLFSRLKDSRMSAVRSILYGALQTYHPEITPKQAATLCFDHFESVMVGLNAALQMSFPDAVKAAALVAEGKKSGNRQARRTAAAGGRGSSKTGAVSDSSQQPISS